MTSFLTIAALLISTILVVDFSRTIAEIRKQHCVTKRKSSSFNV